MLSSAFAPDAHTSADASRPPFPLDALPPVVRAYVEALSAAAPCDPAVVALASLAAVAGAIGGTRRVALKPGVTEPAVVWGVVVLPPGHDGDDAPPPAFDVTAILDRVLAPLHAVQQDWMNSYRNELAAYGGAMRAWTKKMRRWEEASEVYLNSAHKYGAPPRMPDSGDEPERPFLDTLVTHDTTPLAIARVLADALRPGTLLARPWVDAWASAVTRTCAAADGEFWRAAYDGGYVSVRPDPASTPDDLAMPANASRAAVSVIGAARPASLVARPQVGRDPLDRMCLVLPDPMPDAVTWTDAAVPAPVAEAFAAMLGKLTDLRGTRDVPLNADAALAWANAFPDLASDGIAGHAARLALLTLMIRYARFLATNPDVDPDDLAPPEIDTAALNAGIDLARWFAAERSRVRHALASAGDERTRSDILRYVQSLGGSATVRQLMRQGPRFRSSEEARAALDALVRTGRGTWETDGVKSAAVFRLVTTETAGVT